MIENWVASIESLRNTAFNDALCLLALTVDLRITSTPSLRPLVATLFFVEASPYVFPYVFHEFTQVVCSVGIGLGPSKSDTADYQDSVMTKGESCAAITWPTLL
ncbi:hypothetical protein TNCV_2819741 [Trichonephila clavipes]|nr:hypothetical protein TNCV_2819741 [Trichonephila clavipes]